MNCKDCLHYEACKGTYYTAKGCDNIALYEFDGKMYADSGCEYFTDRSEWVHLPCKVGDTVYIIYPDPRYNWGNKELKILELKVYAFHYYDNKVTVEIRGDGKYITWDISCFGVSAFLTREEAEKELERSKR